MYNEFGLRHGGRLLVILVAILFALTLLLGPVADAQADLDCSDFDTQEEAQDELEQDPSDPHRLDADNDGQACEDVDYGTTPPVGETTAADGTTADEANRDGSFVCEAFLRVVRDENGALRRQYRDGNGDDELIVQRFEQCLEADVLAGTIPNKRLPNTGGAPLFGLAVIGVASLVAGASVLGAATRRRK